MPDELLDAHALVDLLWAKTDPHKQLLPHMIDAGCCALAYLESTASTALLSYLSAQWKCSENEAASFTAYLVALHDIGKATPQFQMQSEEELARLKETAVAAVLPDTKLKPVRHEHLSRIITKRIWKNRGENSRLCDAYACVLSLHHQKPDLSDRKKPSVHECWDRIQEELEARVRETFGWPGNLPVPSEMDPVGILLTGILILCDWVASSGAFDRLSGAGDGSFEKSLETARKAMKRYGLIEDHRIDTVTSFQSLWPMISSPRDIQRKCEQLDPEAPLTIIEAPMGEGKTEAALYAAVRSLQSRGKRGIYVALPTQATSNQMYGRFVSMLENVDGGHARLLHGTAFLLRDELRSVRSEDAAEAEKWLGSARMGLLDENGVGTVDQAMGAVLLARFSVLRLLGLAGKALVIDELHAYDAYMSEIIESLLRWCRSLKIPVVLLSATLQKSQRVRYLSCFADHDNMPELSESYPLITQVLTDRSVIQTAAEAAMQTDYRIEPVRFGEEDEKTARFALDKVRGGGCYCVLVNTVRRAQAVYRQLRSLADSDTEVLLFHARFPMGRREAIEKECLLRFGKGELSHRPKKAVLVATQVVEQSLDIDFDGMISELAPIDLLLQRAGRVHRHRDRIRPACMELPVLHVILPADVVAHEPDMKRFGSSGYVYAPFLLHNTEELVEDGITVRVPRDVRAVISKVYEHVTEENLAAWQERAFDQQLMAASADRVAFPPPEPDYFFPAQSRPEFEDLNIDDGFDPSARAATRLGEPTFRIAFTDMEHLRLAESGILSSAQQKEILLSSVSLRLTRDIRERLATGGLCQISRGPLSGCYVTDSDRGIEIGGKKLINDPILGVYWEG